MALPPWQVDQALQQEWGELWPLGWLVVKNLAICVGLYALLCATWWRPKR